MTTAPPADLAAYTIQALRTGRPGLAAFRENFLHCGDLFEQGCDLEARRDLDTLLPRLADFAGFCDAVLQNSGHHLPAAACAPFAALNRQLEAALVELLGTIEQGDAVVSSDVLRYDLCEAMSAYEQAFDQLAVAWNRARSPQIPAL